MLTLRAGVILISSRIFKFLNSASEWSLFIYWEPSLHLRSELFLLPLSQLSSDWLQLKKQKVWIAGGWRFCTRLQVSALIDTKKFESVLNVFTNLTWQSAHASSSFYLMISSVLVATWPWNLYFYVVTGRLTVLIMMNSKCQRCVSPRF